jgi:hypothetical protein
MSERPVKDMRAGAFRGRRDRRTDGRSTQGEEGQKNRWKEHSKELQNR